MDYQFDRYQPAARAAIKTARESGKGKALLVMSGGLGKTIVSADDVADFLENHSGRVLVLCHDPDILEQSRKKFRARLGEDYSLGIFHGKEKTFRKTDVLFASFQILQEQLGWLKQFTPTEFDYLIVDEAHHSRAITYEKVISYFQPKFILGLTATPYREDGKPLDGIFGPAVYQLDYATALKNGYLTPVHYNLMTYEISRISEIAESNNEKFSLSALNERIRTTKSPEELIADVKERLQAHRDPRTVVFCSSIEDVETFSGLLGGSLPLHSKLSLAEQESNLEKFRNGETRTLVVMNMLNEGIDVPEIDVVVRLRPTNSKTLFQQQLFRGARISPDKDRLVVYDYVTNVEQLQILLEFAQQVEAAKGQSDDGNEPPLPRECPFRVTISGGTWHATIVNLEQILSSLKVACYTKEELLQALRDFAAQEQRIPTIKDIGNANGLPSYATFYHHFHSFTEALIAAGLKANAVNSYSKEDIIAAVKDLAAKIGKRPSVEQIDQIPNIPTHPVLNKLFGSHRNLLTAAGLADKPSIHHGSKALSAEETEELRTHWINQLREKGRTLGRTPTQEDVTKDKTMVAPFTYARHFGSWNAALSLAGFSINKIDRTHNYNVEKRRADLIRQLQEKVTRNHGKIPTQTEMNADKLVPAVSTYARNFGSWNNALRAAGFEPVHQK